MNKKTKTVALIIVLVAAVIYAIFSSKNKGATNVGLTDEHFEKIELTSDFNKDELKKASEEAVLLISNLDFDKLLEKSSKEFKEIFGSDTKSVNKEKETVKKIIGKKGKFENVNTGEIECYKDKKTGLVFAIVNSKAKYDKGSIKYAISFNEDNEIISFYLK
ncbi:DUF3887 domain-containing protein [Peptoniphilus stercorisuis]|uniref:DUF3887 domain-containing protein n=1 Tax=Peptoniphilus stercorisuis TaxID=1436965 RepID=A0ABS4KFX7_9FIRM|nr:DUF3887 domain-containing protein [Peptoniphilus stercorisuis]MBP2026166.1 hypothetical protein [Peptoniphilus stercorisuis]